MRLLLDASPLAWPRSGTRTYVESLLRGLSEIGVGAHIDLLSPRGYAHASRTPLDGPSPVLRPPLRFAWAWEQTTGARRGEVLFRPYVAPARRAGQSFAMLDVLTWLPGGGPDSRTGRLVAHRVAAHARRAELVLAISDFTRVEGIAHLGLDPARVRTVRLAPAASFRPDAPRPDGAPDRRYVLWAGGYGGRKRTDLLVEAYRASAELRAASCLALTGTPPVDVVAAAHAAGAAPVVLGAVDETVLAGLYAHAAASCYLSDYEGYGLPPVESLAAGCPVVCSELPSVRESVGDGAAYVEHDPSAVASALLAALDAPRPSARPVRTWADVARETWAAHRTVWPGLPETTT